MCSPITRSTPKPLPNPNRTRPNKVAVIVAADAAVDRGVRKDAPVRLRRVRAIVPRTANVMAIKATAATATARPAPAPKTTAPNAAAAAHAPLKRSTHK